MTMTHYMMLTLIPSNLNIVQQSLLLRQPTKYQPTDLRASFVQRGKMFLSCNPLYLIWFNVQGDLLISERMNEARMRSEKITFHCYSYVEGKKTKKKKTKVKKRGWKTKVKWKGFSSHIFFPVTSKHAKR